jgi:hypothetical protein
MKKGFKQSELISDSRFERSGSDGAEEGIVPMPETFQIKGGKNIDIDKLSHALPSSTWGM